MLTARGVFVVPAAPMRAPGTPMNQKYPGACCWGDTRHKCKGSWVFIAPMHAPDTAFRCMLPGGHTTQSRLASTHVVTRVRYAAYASRPAASARPIASHMARQAGVTAAPAQLEANSHARTGSVTPARVSASETRAVAAEDRGSTA
jgi:hypothetical protein